MSDLHAGAETSLITHLNDNLEEDWTKPSSTTLAFADAFRLTLAEFKQDVPADTILLGDVLDLSLSEPQNTTQVFETFVEEVFADRPNEASINLSHNVFFIPGNHDHSLWTAIRYQNESFVEDVDDRPSVNNFRGKLERFGQVTPAFGPSFGPAYEHFLDRIQSNLLAQIFAAGGRNCKLPTLYPNMGDTNADGNRAVVFHHGHFIENTYKLLSIIVAAFHGRTCGPLTAQQLEMENGNWIDFGWSTLGENGPIGQDVASVYQFLLTGSAEGRLQNRFSDTLAKNLMKSLPLPQTSQVKGAIEIIAKGIIDATVGKFSQTERLSYTSYLGPDSIQGVKDYLTGAVEPQIRDELGSARAERAGQRDPDVEIETTFVFGHTHKPFEDYIIADEFAAPVKVFNTGGWVQDTSLMGTKEGASVIFVDEDMNVAALRVYGSPINGVCPPVSVKSLGGENPLQHKLEAALAKDDIKKSWANFSEVVARELMLRQKYIFKATREADVISGSIGVSNAVS